MNNELGTHSDLPQAQTLPLESAKTWKLKSRTLRLGEWPLLMGIVNVTPDSFSDGGAFVDADHAVNHALQLVRDGAAIIDVGGESTRPYSQPVELAEELRRVIPVIQKLHATTDVPISIDTSKAVVARAALEAGAEIINDVSGLEADPEMVPLARKTGAGLCVMHMQGTPQTMQDDPAYDDVVADIAKYLHDRLKCLVAAGVDPAKICLDPGIGFGKTHRHNLTLINNCDQFHRLGRPILIGHSRKGFISKIIGSNEIADRDLGTLALSLFLRQRRIQILRVHDVAATHKAYAVLRALDQGELSGLSRQS